jgi:hypothetical protein
MAASEGKCVESELNIGDYIPYLAWMDLQGLNRRLKNIHKTQEKIVEEHFSQNKPNVMPDLLDVLLAASADENLGLQITRDNIKSVVYVYYLLAHTSIYRFSRFRFQWLCIKYDNRDIDLDVFIGRISCPLAPLLY